MQEIDSYKHLPGADLVRQGLQDIARQKISECSLLLQVAAPRLRFLGIEIPLLSNAALPTQVPYEHQLYDHIQNSGGYSLYKSLLRRIASFAGCLEREKSMKQSLVES
jgi:hypothetical protein